MSDTFMLIGFLILALLNGSLSIIVILHVKHCTALILQDLGVVCDKLDEILKKFTTPKD